MCDKDYYMYVQTYRNSLKIFKHKRKDSVTNSNPKEVLLIDMDIISVLLIFVASFICALIAKALWKNGADALDTTLPGPKTFPVIGNLLDLDFHHLHLSLFDMVKIYGAIFQIKFFGRTAVIINDAELMRKALSGHEYGDIFNDRPDAFFGKHLAFDCSDIGFAKANNKMTMLRKMFHRALNFYGNGVKYFDRTIAVELERLKEEFRQTCQHDINLSEKLGVSVANTTTTLMTGEPPKPGDSDTIMKFNNIGNYFLGSMSFIYEALPIIRLLPGRAGTMFREAIAARDKFLDRFYFALKEKMKVTGLEHNDEPGFVKRLIRLQDEINKRAGTNMITDTNLKAIIVDIVFGATDTTSNAIIHAFALLVTHPGVMKNIQTEIERVVGPARMPEVSDQAAMPYTMATVYDMLRYTSAIGPLSAPHRALEDQTFEGYVIERNSIILSNLWYIHHDPRLWDNPWIFDPGRFLDRNGFLLSPEHPNRRNMLAFSIGSRGCPGKNFGKSRVFLYLAAILQSFDVLPASDGKLPETDPRDYQPTGGLIMIKPHLCRVVPRKKS